MPRSSIFIVEDFLIPTGNAFHNFATAWQDALKGFDVNAYLSNNFKRSINFRLDLDAIWLYQSPFYINESVFLQLCTSVQFSNQLFSKIDALIVKAEALRHLARESLQNSTDDEAISELVEKHERSANIAWLAMAIEGSISTDRNLKPRNSSPIPPVRLKFEDFIMNLQDTSKYLLSTAHYLDTYVILPQKQTSPESDEHDVDSIPPCMEQAYRSYEYAISQVTEEMTDDKVYDWIKLHGIEGYRPPAFETWKNYVSKGRSHYGTLKNQPRADRKGRSVVSENEL